MAGASEAFVLANAEIASLLWISPGTVRKHLENAYEKLGISYAYRRDSCSVFQSGISDPKLGRAASETLRPPKMANVLLIRESRRTQNANVLLMDS